MRRGGSALMTLVSERALGGCGSGRGVLRSLLPGACSLSTSSCEDLKQYDLACGKQAKLFVPRSHKGGNGGHGVARLLLDRMQARNALGKDMLADLDKCVAKATELGLAHKIRCLVLHSTSETVFCAGADLKERQRMSEKEVLAFVRRLRKSFQALHEVPVPTVAAVGGVALGGGLELALACDLRVGSDTCVVGLPETRLAIIPGAGGTQYLPRIVGLAKAKDLIFTGRQLKAYEAYEFGVLDRYTFQRTAVAEALALAREIVQGGPVALNMAKEAVTKGMGHSDLTKALAVEDKCYARVIPTKDRVEALEAFANKRKPVFKGA